MTDDGKGIRTPVSVLVVDDDKDSADSLTALLRLGGCRAHAAYSGPVAVLLAEHHRPDVILLDLAMPRMSGYKVAETLRRHPATKDALLIAVTGLSQGSDRDHSRQSGFDLHLLKPVDTERLLQLLHGDPTPLLEGSLS